MIKTDDASSPADKLPRFTYHPDPIATGAVEVSDRTCMRCDQARGFVYSRTPYGRRDGVVVCPWCVADGSAARDLGASFVQDVEDGAPDHVADELYHRTPGYESWQGEMWLTHCGDACEYRGDATREDLTALTPDEETAFLSDNDWPKAFWDALKTDYEPGGDISLYRFVCRHCGTTRLGVDMS